MGHLVVFLLLLQTFFLVKFNSTNIYSLFIVETSEITPSLTETRKYPLPYHKQINHHIVSGDILAKNTESTTAQKTSTNQKETTTSTTASTTTTTIKSTEKV